jgi:hypothetical protein
VIQVRVAKLAVDSSTQSPVVLLEGIDAKGVLPIWIGPPEANAILLQLNNQTYERPLTHDLLRIVIEGLDARVRKVVITELRGNTFFAKIYLGRGDEILAIDARPSDSIALALRTQAPIYVDPDLFESNRRDVGTTLPVGSQDDADEDEGGPLGNLFDDDEDEDDGSPHDKLDG